jgi:5,10-methylenetetrahydromethanopterin reductase
VKMRISLQMHSLNTIDSWIQLACKAEEYGFAEIRIAERIDFPFPTWPTLFLMAEHTSRIGLGTGVTNPYSRHPALTAKYVTFLDIYSQGRATLGIGQGDSWEFDQMGINHDHPLTSLREAVLVVRHLLKRDSTPFNGKIFRVPSGFQLGCQPYRENLPIFVGSGSPGGMRVAGAVADALHLPFCLDHTYIAFARKHLQKGMVNNGREGQTIPIVCSPLVSLSTDRQIAIQHAKVRLAEFIEWAKTPCRHLGIPEELVSGLVDAHRSKDHSYLFKNVTSEILRAFTFAGTPSDVIEQMETLESAGIHHVTLSSPGPDLNEALRLIGTEILPHFSR